MSSERLARLVDFGGSNDMDSLLVTRHGRIVLEATYAPFRAGLKHRFYSVDQVRRQQPGRHGARPTAGSTAPTAGCVDFFADRTIANLDERKKAITVRHLLDMTSGLAWQEGLDGWPESLHRHGAQPGLAAVRPRPADGDAAGHASSTTTAATASCCRPSSARSPARARSTMRARRCSDRSASTTCCGAATRRASRAAAPTSTCIRATWRSSATSGCAAACGKAGRSCRRRGSRACARPMSTCARAGRATCATAASSGSCRAATPISRSAITASSSSSCRSSTSWRW